MTNATINLMFKPETTDEEKEKTLKTISSWAEVASAELLKPDSRNTTIQRMAFLYVRSTNKLKLVKARLEELNVFQSVSCPAQRKLVKDK